MTARHESNIRITIPLDASPVQERGFGAVVLIVPKSANSLDGKRVVAFENVDDAQNMAAAGHLASSTLDAVRVAFSQNPAPEQFKVGNVDLVGEETYSDALAAILAVDSDVYGVCIGSRDPGDIAAVAADVEAREMAFSAQCGASSMYDGTLPAGLTNERNTRVVFHDEDSEWADVAWLVNRLAFNPDTISVPWSVGLSGINPYTRGLTAGERSAMIAGNINVGLPYGGELFYVDPGVSVSGHPCYEILSAHWFSARLRERIAQLRTSKSARGEKIPVDIVGQTIILAEVHALIDQGEAAGHFLPDSRHIVAEPITAADRAQRRIRISGHVRLAGDARLFDISLAFTR